MGTNAFTVFALLLAAAAGYLLGSVNSAIIVTRLYKNDQDIRKQGSGNAGMTNVLRMVGKVPALLTFVGDFLKCVLAVLIAWAAAALLGLSPEWVRVAKYAAGAFCVIGHAFPLFYGFRGGKCIVTSAALMCMTDWRVFLLILATFGLLFLMKRIISLGSVVCAAMYPVYAFLTAFFLEYRQGSCSLGYLVFVTGLALFLGVLVLFRHRANIGRLLRGEEKPIAAKKKT